MKVWSQNSRLKLEVPFKKPTGLLTNRPGSNFPNLEVGIFTMYQEFVRLCARLGGGR